MLLSGLMTRLIAIPFIRRDGRRYYLSTKISLLYLGTYPLPAAVVAAASLESGPCCMKSVADYAQMQTVGFSASVNGPPGHGRSMRYFTEVRVSQAELAQQHKGLPGAVSAATSSRLEIWSALIILGYLCRGSNNT